jgi:hypothetical protein
MDVCSCELEGSVSHMGVVLTGVLAHMCSTRNSTVGTEPVVKSWQHSRCGHSFPEATGTLPRTLLSCIRASMSNGKHETYTSASEGSSNY